MKSLPWWCQGNIFLLFTVGKVREKVTSISKYGTLVWLQKKLWHYTTCRRYTFHNRQTSKGEVCSHAAVMGLCVLFFRCSQVSQKSQHAEALYLLTQCPSPTGLQRDIFKLDVREQGSLGGADVGYRVQCQELRSWDFPGFLTKICSRLWGRIPTGTFLCTWQDAESLTQLII